MNTPGAARPPRTPGAKGRRDTPRPSPKRSAIAHSHNPESSWNPREARKLLTRRQILFRATFLNLRRVAILSLDRFWPIRESHSVAPDSDPDTHTRYVRLRETSRVTETLPWCGVRAFPAKPFGDVPRVLPVD